MTTFKILLRITIYFCIPDEGVKPLHPMFPITPLVEFVGGKPKETEMKDEMKEEKLDLEKVQRICLGGGFKYFWNFHPHFGEDFQFD